MSSKSKTTATKEEAPPALVPKLRFPDFRVAEGWKIKKLSTMVQLVSGMHLSPGQYGKEGDVPYFTGPSDFTNDVEAITKRTSDSASIAKEEDTLITVKGSGVGELWHLTLPSVAMGRQLMAVRSLNAASRFVLQFLLTKRRRFEDLAAGNLIPGLSRGDILDLEVPFPKAPEQQKIAECLSSVDELIAAQARKLDALKTHKKGLMQQLFPREGETQPRLRFPEFQNAGEWEERKLGTVCDIQRGKFSHRPRNDPKFFGGPYPFIQTGDVVKSGGGAVIASQSLNEEGLSVSKLFQPTILLITIAANIGDTGLLQTEGCFTDSVVGLIPKKDVIPVFLELIMRGQKENLNKVATTGAQKNINNEILREVSVLLPSVPEQQRIADCLTSLDDLIAAQTQKHEALKTHKKGLMQQLFPSPEE